MPNCQWAKRHCFMSCLSNAEEPKIHASKQHKSDSHTAPGRRGSFGGICGGLGRRKEMAEMPLADLRDRPFRAPLLHLLCKRRHGSEIQALRSRLRPQPKLSIRYKENFAAAGAVKDYAII